MYVPRFTPRGGGGTVTPRTVQRLRLADGFVLASDPNSIVQSAVDASNGVTVTLANPGLTRDLPHTGACWSRAGVYSPEGDLVSPWSPSLRLPIALIQERAKSATAPLLIRGGLLWMNTSDPTTATEGFGYYLDYPSTDLRRVGIVRVTSLGVWSASSTTTATGRNDHFGAFCTTGCGGLTALQGLIALGTDINGAPAVPQGSNKATQTAAVTATGTAGWYTAIWAAWAATGGTIGDFLTFDPQYWLSDQEGDLG